MKDKIIHFLLRLMRHQPGTVIDEGRRKYVIDCHGARRRLGREK